MLITTAIPIVPKKNTGSIHESVAKISIIMSIGISMNIALTT